MASSQAISEDLRRLPMISTRTGRLSSGLGCCEGTAVRSSPYTTPQKAVRAGPTCSYSPHKAEIQGELSFEERLPISPSDLQPSNSAADLRKVRRGLEMG